LNGAGFLVDRKGVYQGNWEAGASVAHRVLDFDDLNLGTNSEGKDDEGDVMTARLITKVDQSDSEGDLKNLVKREEGDCSPGVLSAG
jgi:hypothetical protein